MVVRLPKEQKFKEYTIEVIIHPPPYEGISIWALYDKKLAGSCELGLVKEEFMGYKGPFLWFSRLFVKPEHRGKGLASHMLEKACRWADEKGYPILNLARPYVGEEMPAEELIEFYKKFGFEVKEYEPGVSAIMWREPKKRSYSFKPKTILEWLKERPTLILKQPLVRSWRVV